ncbi:MAG: translocation/assembly module TamB domain-containing protein, partial [Gallionella sp.]|nr:translocation/assembly module TamB domain-containing protein [Gallionella sp.]
ALTFDLDMDLGDNFFIKGQGLDAQLGGALKLTAANGASPVSRGSVRVSKGSYSAYGQRLEIERGILNFQGPLDNPSLNILAWRKNQAVEAGVSLTGTAQSPRVNLVSNPNVSDSKKLSWLVLGHDLEASDGKDFSAMQAAAGALLAGNESIALQQKIAHAAGLEEVSIRGAGGLESTMLTLGKRLSSRAYLSYEQGLTGVGTLMKINYTLTKRLSAQAQAGTTPAVDLFYTFSFD